MLAQITIKPLAELTDYNRTLYVVSDLKVGQANAFFSGYGENHIPFGLPEASLPPTGFQAGWWPRLSEWDEMLSEHLGITARSHYSVDGHHNLQKVPNFPQVAQEGIERFVKLAEENGARVVVSPDMETLYCSPKPSE